MPSTCCHSGCRANLPLPFFAFASTSYSHSVAQSTWVLPVPVPVHRTFCETASCNNVEWTLANRTLGQNSCLNAQNFGWKREPFYPLNKLTSWVMSNESKVNPVPMTAVATQSTAEVEVIVKVEGQPSPEL